MHLTLNTSETTIDEEHRDGDRWLIARNIRIIKPKRLSNGYVPAGSIDNSVDQENTHGGTGWDDLPATLGHPRNLSAHSWHEPARPDGEPVLASTPGVTEALGLGQMENQRAEDGEVYVDVAVNADKADEVGGEAEDVVTALENEASLDVSTQYVGAELPPGEYDGEQRDAAEAIVAPDSLALLPNAPGQCSTLDGCGVNPVSAPLGIAANSAESPLYLETGHAPEDGDDGETPDHPRGTAAEIRTVAANAIDSIRSLGSGSPGAPGSDGVSGIGDVDLDDATETAITVGTNGGAGGCGCGCGDDGDCNHNHTTDNDNEPMEDKALADALNVSLDYVEGLSNDERATLEAAAQDGASDDGNTGDNGGDDGDDDGADDDGTDDGSDTDDGADNDSDSDTIVVDRSELDSIIDDRVEQRVAANEQQRELGTRVDRIVANSAEYEEDDREELMNTPEGVLDRIERGLDARSSVPAAGSPGVTANEDDIDMDNVGTGTIDDITASSGGD